MKRFCNTLAILPGAAFVAAILAVLILSSAAQAAVTITSTSRLIGGLVDVPIFGTTGEVKSDGSLPFGAPFADGVALVSGTPGGSPYSIADSVMDSSEITVDGFSATGTSLGEGSGDDLGLALPAGSGFSIGGGTPTLNKSSFIVEFSVGPGMSYSMLIDGFVDSSAFFYGGMDVVAASASILLEEAVGGLIFEISSSADGTTSTGPDFIDTSIALPPGDYTFTALADSGLAVFGDSSLAPGARAPTAAAASFGFTVSIVPEPSRALLLIGGILGALLVRDRRR